jgi:glycosyltransferase involved in cell wall biosynthesis
MVYWPLKYGLVAIVQRGICLLLTRIADVLITSIDLYADLLRNYTHKPVHLIPIGSNILPVPVTDEELRVIRQRIAPNGEGVISTFGLRSQDLLLQVFEEVLRQQPHTRLLICSKLKVSASQQECYEQLKSKIVVTGFMDASDVYRHLRASDVYFMPDYVNERGEGGTCNKSTSLATGLVAGLPVVGTRGDMNNSLLLKTPGVFLEEISRPDVIAERLLTLLADSDSQSSRKLISQFVQERLNWPTIYQSYKDVIGKKLKQLQTV